MFREPEPEHPLTQCIQLCDNFINDYTKKDAAAELRKANIIKLKALLMKMLDQKIQIIDAQEFLNMKIQEYCEHGRRSWFSSKRITPAEFQKLSSKHSYAHLLKEIKARIDLLTPVNRSTKQLLAAMPTKFKVFSVFFHALIKQYVEALKIIKDVRADEKSPSTKNMDMVLTKLSKAIYDFADANPDLPSRQKNAFIDLCSELRVLLLKIVDNSLNALSKDNSDDLSEDNLDEAPTEKNDNISKMIILLQLHRERIISLPDMKNYLEQREVKLEVEKVAPAERNPVMYVPSFELSEEEYNDAKSWASSQSSENFNLTNFTKTSQ
jgi:hypothetical protein